ncbi:MAG: hypothetical protein U9R38_02775 [Candidatus Margulisiibacteriota bacterium]|nr:hypothetical protein [Candidatus Margulisiibacteriota bacterium]
MASEALVQKPVVRNIQAPLAKGAGAGHPAIELSAEAILEYVTGIERFKKGPHHQTFERRPIKAGAALAGNIPDIPIKKFTVKLEVHGPEIPAEYQPPIKTNTETRLQTLRMIALLSKGTKLYKDTVNALEEEQLLTQGAAA